MSQFKSTVPLDRETILHLSRESDLTHYSGDNGGEEHVNWRDDVDLTPYLERFAEAIARTVRGELPDGWIAWTGGESPVVPNAIVEFKMREWPETVVGPCAAGGLRWAHGELASDIVAYREITS